MPETDPYFRQMVSWALHNREVPIEKLFVCDKQPSIQSLIPKWVGIVMGEGNKWNIFTDILDCRT